MRSLIFICFFWPGIFIAQGQHADSLMKKNLLPAKTSSDKVKLLNLLAEESIKKDNQLSLSYSRQALYLSKKNNDQVGVAIALNNMAMAYREQGDYEAAATHSFQALKLSDSIANSAQKQRAIECIGLIMQYQGDYEKALTYFNEALNLANQIGNKANIATSLNNVGSSHIFKKQYNQALDFYTRSLTIRHEIGDSSGIARSLNNIGYVYKNKGLYAKALEYYYHSLDIIEKQPDMQADLAAILDNLGDIYFLTGQYKESLNYYQQSLAQAEEGKSLQRMKEAYEGLAEVNFKLKQYEQYYDFNRKYIAIQDSIYSSRNSARVTEIQAQYGSEKKEKLIQLLRKEKEIANLKRTSQEQAFELRERRIINYSLGVAMLLVVILSAIYYQRSLDRRKTNQLLAEQNATIIAQNERLHQVNQKLTDSENYLLQLNATKDKFFSIIAHDLKSPLNSLIGFLHILSARVDAFSPEELSKFARDMNKSVGSLMELLDNLLQWARSQTQTIDFEPSTLDLSDVVTSNISLVHASAQNKNLQVISEIEAGQTVFADKNMLSSVLRNLISNAIKFTPSGGQITISSQSLENEVEVKVQDTGIGIGPTGLEKLFRLDTYHTTLGTASEKGNGLGLILCKEFVERNGGTITVESEQKKGTTFRFTIPKVPIEVSLPSNPVNRMHF